MREIGLSDRLLRDAASLVDESSALEIEWWASGWFGQAWREAGIDDRRRSEHLLCAEVAARASSRPSPAGLAAVAALRRVAPPSEHSLLDETVEELARDQPRPPWIDAPVARPVAAWHGVDVWDSRRVLFVEYADALRPHTLLASLTTLGGVQVEKLGLVDPSAPIRWEEMREPDDVPLPLSPAPVEEVLAELAAAMEFTDMVWPGPDDEGFIELRALAWSRCRAYLPPRPSLEELTSRDDETAAARRTALIEDFLAEARVGAIDPDVVRYLAGLFLDYGEGYIRADALAWSPPQVEVFMTDWVPRKVVMDAGDRAALPAVLRAWVRFALRRRGIEDRWIKPVVAVVDDCTEEFEAAFDDETSWGPAKQLVAQLEHRGIDLTDEDAVEQVIREVNAENLARSFFEHRDR